MRTPATATRLDASAERETTGRAEPTVKADAEAAKSARQRT
eukprot:CAMPEP_0179940890 /NCGR_PEP_ID=MMETSP0983-20121128/16609_1 /TAXON_ID=483367 /ORGANISM="non described non described, Strain CCMP 2436" /LENGTH=40 /DNA_ID= /DNA_START= /DNA_END= /DNA_ORIENTATION=